jgi:hypothetical protein
VRTHPDTNASRDRATTHAIAKVFREQHRASVARCCNARCRLTLRVKCQCVNR